jgi:uncharacterized protein YbaR (Trm112 family)
MSRSLFWVTCPVCSREFVVDSSLRHAGLQLICPFCRHRFLPDEAAELDDRSGT